MKLGKGSNKVDAVKSWLSIGTNSDWLLIFDNADALNVDITKFIPSVSWGHIIVTSRDEAAIGSVALQGSVIGNLTVEEAVHILIARSLAPMVTPEDMLNAEAIVELLGCLPLAVDQAGAYIRARQKTLTEYLRLLRHKQEDLLMWRPRVGDYDKTVLTAWELNFRQVELESDIAKRLLLLCCFIDPADISELLLLRGCTAQRRWSAEGEKIDVQPDDSLRDKALVETISNEIAFDAAVEKLLSFHCFGGTTTSTKLGVSRSILLSSLLQHNDLRLRNRILGDYRPFFLSPTHFLVARISNLGKAFSLDAIAID
jgi:hypothetical protein